MTNLLTQYADLIRARTDKVLSEYGKPGTPDMRVGWLLWQESLRQFMYFEQQMIAPDPNDYYAEWVDSGGGVRKKSRNLWIYEKETGKKRYSVTTEAGAKVQPYFDVPPPTDRNLYIFTVIGEEIKVGLVRVWVTESTYDELKRLIGDLGDHERLTQAIKESINRIPRGESAGSINVERGCSLILGADAYQALTEAVGGVNDDHSFRLLARALSKG